MLVASYIWHVINNTVLTIDQKNNYADEEGLGMLAQKAGLFALTVITFSEPHSMNSVIEELRLVECVHIHLLISTSSSSDKTF